MACTVNAGCFVQAFAYGVHVAFYHPCVVGNVSRYVDKHESPKCVQSVDAVEDYVNCNHANKRRKDLQDKQAHQKRFLKDKLEARKDVCAKGCNYNRQHGSPQGNDKRVLEPEPILGFCKEVDKMLPCKAVAKWYYAKPRNVVGRAKGCTNDVDQRIEHKERDKNKKRIDYEFVERRNNVVSCFHTSPSLYALVFINW